MSSSSKTKPRLGRSAGRNELSRCLYLVAASGCLSLALSGCAGFLTQSRPPTGIQKPPDPYQKALQEAPSGSRLARCNGAREGIVLVCTTS